MCIARAAPEAKVYSVEFAEANAEIARRIWGSRRVDAELPCGRQSVTRPGTLQALADEGFEAGGLDLLFLDHAKART